MVGGVLNQEAVEPTTGSEGGGAMTALSFPFRGQGEELWLLSSLPGSRCSGALPYRGGPVSRFSGA